MANFDPSDTSDRLTCIHTSLTCRSFSEPALRRLWHTLDSLLPLENIILPFYQPFHAVLRERPRMLSRDSEPRQDHAEKIISTSAYSNEAKLERLRICAARVESLVFKTTLEPSEFVLLLDLALLAGAPIFPRLKKLHYRLRWHARETELPFAFSSSLEELSLTSITEEDKHRTPPLIAAFIKHCPQISRFALTMMPGYFPDRLAKTWQAVSGFSHLRHLTTSYAPTPVILIQIATRRSTIETIECEYVDSPYTEPAPLPLSPPVRTTQLTVLKLGGPKAGIDAILQSVLAPRLTHLHLDVPQMTDTRVLHTVASLPLARSLRTLSLVLDSGRFWQYRFPLSLSHLLRPLRTISQLAEVSITITSCTEVTATDGDFHALAHAWPLLRRLRLVYINRDDVHWGAQPIETLYGHTHTHAAATLSALRHFARGCPALETLELDMLEARLDAGLEGGDSVAGASASALAVLQVWADDRGARDEERPNALQVARFVDGLFPQLDLRQSWIRDTRGVGGDVWEKMEGLRQGGEVDCLAVSAMSVSS
ncbi:uncharacterized protein BXZ73DRAFT_111421 [Epithele typhae]|uniref:uncharacterized protein n=1 Tax=Epithele typhae TaxID=378194 RepID=UPI0020086402|nr:uncharacterized protein BXZ73DRAFT_111421 [Epithele typhae]KAH9903517.1 hypothetical protein BXZ73DRAFT_111421 [Epithele typhae]